MKSPLSPWLQHKRVMQRIWSRRHRARKTAQGLTCRGTVRKYKLHPEITRVHGKARVIVLNRLYRRLLREQGLSSRGTPYKSPMNQVEKDWTALRATMVLNVPKMMTPLER